MVKEGPFVNGDKDYPTKCSKLAHLKRSGRIIEDVSSSCQAASLPAEEEKELQLGKVNKQDATTVQYIEAKSSAHTIDEEMPDFEAISSLKDGTQVQPILKTPTVGQQSVDDHQVSGVRLSPWGFSSAHNFLESQQAKVVRVERSNSEALFRNSPDRNVHHDMESMPLQIVSRRVFQDITPASQFDSPMKNSVPQNVVAEDFEGEIYQEAENNELMASYHDAAAEAKLKLILSQDMEAAFLKVKGIMRTKAFSSKCCVEFIIIRPTNSTKKEMNQALWMN
ncbi:hypothetical protein L1049_016564 [Liquidambar formosana]|uniref:Uncharacterized protein n=1 Tax=Liquidambar formosana TaxID=63359 RepID=A0AAP0X365_LIQFO